MPDAKQSPPIAPVYGHSNASLDGMEKSVPSFRDFLKTVPPSRPPQRKPLPPVPQAHEPSVAPLAPTITTTQLPDRRSSRSDGSLWTAPPSWEYDDESGEDQTLTPPEDYLLQSETYTISNPNLSEPEGPHPPLLEPRTFAPLIPDASPCPSPGTLTPSFEYDTRFEFPPSPASSKPPQTPLPPIPAVGSPSKPKGLKLVDPDATPFSSSSPGSPGNAKSPTTSLLDTPPQTSFSFGIRTPTSPQTRAWSTVPQSPPWIRNYSLYIQTAEQAESLRRLVPRSAAPGVDDEWEDIEETRRIRQDRLSQDYHAALVEQYRDLVSPSEEIFDEARRDSHTHGKITRDSIMIPAPLSYQKGRDQRYESFDRSSPHPEDHYELSSAVSPKRKSSIREKLPALAAGTLNMILPSQHSRKLSTTSSRSGEIPISPPADHQAFAQVTPQQRLNNPSTWLRSSPKSRPRSRAFPVAQRYSGVYALRTKPAVNPGKKKGKKRKNQPLEHTPPLALTLTSSLSSQATASPRPSVEGKGSVTAAPYSPAHSVTSQMRYASSTHSSISSSRLESRATALDRGPRSPGNAARVDQRAASSTTHTPSPLQCGLTHTELFTGPALTSTQSGDRAYPSVAPSMGSAASGSRPAYPRRMSTASSAPSQSVRGQQQLTQESKKQNASHRRQKSTTARVSGAVQHVLGIGHHKPAGRQPTAATLAPRLPFVHERDDRGRGFSPSPTNSASSRSTSASGRSASAAPGSGSGGLPTVRSLAAAAVSPAGSLSRTSTPAGGGGARHHHHPRRSSSSRNDGGTRSLRSVSVTSSSLSSSSTTTTAPEPGEPGGLRSPTAAPEHQRLSLVKRAVEAHRAHRRERRRSEIKKSIRVLGQTDPQVVEGYVRLAAGPASGPGVRPVGVGEVVPGKKGQGRVEGENWL